MTVQDGIAEIADGDKIMRVTMGSSRYLFDACVNHGVSNISAGG